MSEADLAKVNEARDGKTYLDTDAATELLGSIAKPPLKKSPFAKIFEAEANEEGCWTYAQW